MKLHLANVFIAFFTLALLPAHPARAHEDDEDWQEPKRVRTMLVVPRVSHGGRAPVFMDAVEHQLVHGTWKTPKAGESIGLPNGPRGTWKEIRADEKGWFQNAALRGGYGLATVYSGKDRVVLLSARGHRHVYVNGVPRVGDVYNAGITRIAIQLRKGTNELLFKGGRGRMKATLDASTPRDTPVFFEKKDRTLPDVLHGRPEKMVAGVIVTNATGGWWDNLSISATFGSKTVSTPWFSLPPLSSRKIAVRLPVIASEDETVEVEIEVYDDDEEDDEPLDKDVLTLRVRHPDQHHKRTFVSMIDGSTQYYGVVPPAHDGDEPPAYVLSLHGAGVEAMRQAGCYRMKDWAVVVAPSNRRPFGFDWEDWGRLDALEVLADSHHRFGADWRRTYLTGHSMGGHGTWSLGAHMAGRFAAIAPSAGWRDFWSYGGGVAWKDPTPVQAMLDRAANVSRTLLLESNYRHHGIYVLHGDKDENVPVSQARFMRERLAKFHTNFAYYEQPGAGHWWGNQCMDWPPLFDFLKRNVLPEPHTLTKLAFTTISPGINDRCHWLRILSQNKPLEPSTLAVEMKPKQRLLAVKTSNVARLELDLTAFAARDVLPADTPVRIELNDEDPFELPWPADGVVTVSRARDGAWRHDAGLAHWYKNPRRYGTFKDAFRNDVVFVYGTGGTKAQADWAFHKARYDAETFWYRGNGSIEVVSDTRFDPLSNTDRNVVLYGNRDGNSAWKKVLGDHDWKIHDDRLEVGDRVFEGGDIGLLFIYPRKDSEVASVGVVAGTGLPGMRVTNQIPYFLSGAGFPDWIVYGAEMTQLGSKGVRGAGFFDDDWALRDDAAWRD